MTHLSWDRTHGVARHRGVSCELTEPPRLSGVHRIVELNFTPESRNAEIRESGGAVRPMTPREITEVLAILDDIAAGPHGVLLKNAATPDLSNEPGEPCLQAWRNLTEAVAKQDECKRLIACMHRNGIDYADVAALFARLRADGAIVIGMAVAAARSKPR